MVFLTAGFWRHCLMAILMQSVFRRLTVMQLCNVDVLPFVFTRLLKALTLTRNAPSLEMSPFAVVFSLVSSTPCLNAMNLIPLNASQEFYLTLWLYTKTAHYKFRDKLGCSDCCCFFLSLPCKWCLITMVFQTLWVLRILPNGDTDVVKWQLLMLVCVFKSLMWVYTDWCWSAGVVTKMKMQRTIVIRRDYLHYIRKYNRFEKRHKNMSVHLSPCFR